MVYRLSGLAMGVAFVGWVEGGRGCSGLLYTAGSCMGRGKHSKVVFVCRTGDASTRMLRELGMVLGLGWCCLLKAARLLRLHFYPLDMRHHV